MSKVLSAEPVSNELLPPLPKPRPVARLSFQSPLSRLVLISLLLAILMIPSCQIRDVISERSQRSSQAIGEVTGKWGGAQTLVAPVLRVPYRLREVKVDSKGVATEGFSSVQYAYFLPRTLDINAQQEVQQRTRGIFQVPVFNTRITAGGNFAAPSLAELKLQSDDAVLDLANTELLIGLSDPRSLQAGASLSIDGQPYALRPAGTSINGLRATIGNVITADKLWDGMRYDISFSVNGSGSLSFAPMAEETHVSLHGNWPHPSFDGDWLPVKREINEHGFSAEWSVSYLGRNIAQQWNDYSASTDNEKVQGKYTQRFGVSLVSPVDTYSMAERITKYGLLTLVFTFGVIWLTEVLSGVRLHPIQYGFIGAALCLFALLQLSFAEHFGFNAAFLVSAAAVVSMVTFYCRAALKRTGRALLVGGVLSGLYGYLYMILKAEDYALLGGSLALFAALATAMWLTRRIDWTSNRDAT